MIFKIPDAEVGNPIEFMPITDVDGPTIDPVKGTPCGPFAPIIAFPTDVPIDPIAPTGGGLIGRVIAKPAEDEKN